METPQNDYQRLALLSRQTAWGIGLIMVILLGFVGYWFLKSSEENEEERTKFPIGWCGNRDAPGAEAGKNLFIGMCAACHAKNMKDDLVGPALARSFDAWQHDTLAYFAFIRNSQASIKKRYPRALKIWRAYRPTQMTGFPQLTDKELHDIMAYIYFWY